jgi:hypothetical protein
MTKVTQALLLGSFTLPLVFSTSVAAQEAPTLRDSHRKIRRTEGQIARRAVRRATQQQTGGGSAPPHLSPSVLLIFL